MIPLPTILPALRGIGLRGAAEIALVAALGVQTVRIEGLKIWPFEIEGTAAANTRLTADVKRMTDAQAEATRKQVAQERTEIGQKIELAETFHDQAEPTRLAVAAAVADYARAHPIKLCRAQAIDGAFSGTGAAGVPGDPGQPAAPDPAADMVAIPRTDFNHLSEGAVQGAIKTRFLNALVDGGWAVPLSKVALPEPAFGREPDQ